MRFDAAIVVLTAGLAALHGWSQACFLEGIHGPRSGLAAVAHPGRGFRLTATLTLTAVPHSNALEMRPMSGSLHWFASHSFNLDWSFYLRADKAVKCSYGGFDWDDDAFAARVDEAATQLEILLDPGTYDGRGTDSRRLPGALVVDFTFNL